ncbi:uncharacterized protein LOC119829151 [Zerene cesonia]|uniref:uncharacterized protein LOC119829151 n=1 Tax=Zerene cesonia TaxID=33412 RepID=UPI0018E5A972|nr:uncharacterized protein LOC119829151 [Zerene cesonia]
MAFNKENNKSFIVKSKIPLPVDPLPGISKKILKKQNSENERRPLKTLLAQASNVPSQDFRRDVKNVVQKKYKLRKSRSLTPNSRHVTVRSNQDNLDWDYKVFKDEGNSSVIYISDDEVEEIAREDEAKYKRRLKFNESSSDIVKSPDLSTSSYTDSLPREYESEIFTYLIIKEHKWPKHLTTPNATRACILNWLLKVNGAGGNPATIQTATWYLDSVLAVGPVPIEKLQLFATACFWIAQKIHGPVTTAHKLVKCSNHAFTTQYLLKAEALILKNLKMPPQPVLPQEFVTYLSLWCNDNDPDIELAATFICMCGMILDMGLLDEYPSVIGAAAVRNALILLRKHDLLEKLEMCPVFEDIEKKSNLYNVCAIQRKAVLMLSSPLFEYKAPLELYNSSPQNVPVKILLEAKYLSMVDKRSKIDYVPKRSPG